MLNQIRLIHDSGNSVVEALITDAAGNSSTHRFAGNVTFGINARDNGYFKAEVEVTPVARKREPADRSVPPSRYTG